MKLPEDVIVIGLFGGAGHGKDEACQMIIDLFARRGMKAARISIGKEPKRALTKLYTLAASYEKKMTSDAKFSITSDEKSALKQVKALNKEKNVDLACVFKMAKKELNNAYKLYRSFDKKVKRKAGVTKKEREAHQYLVELTKLWRMDLDSVLAIAKTNKVDFEDPWLDIASSKKGGRDFKNFVVRQFITDYATDTSRNEPHRFHHAIEKHQISPALRDGAKVLIVTDVRAAGQNTPQNDAAWIDGLGGYLVEVRLNDDGSIKKVEVATKPKTPTEQRVDSYLATLQKHELASQIEAPEATDALEVEASYLREHAEARIVWVKFVKLPTGVKPEAYPLRAMMDLKLIKHNSKIDPPIVSTEDPRSRSLRRSEQRRRAQAHRAPIRMV